VSKMIQSRFEWSRFNLSFWYLERIHKWPSCSICDSSE